MEHLQNLEKLNLYYNNIDDFEELKLLRANANLKVKGKSIPRSFILKNRKTVLDFFWSKFRIVKSGEHEYRKLVHEIKTTLTDGRT